MRNFLGSEPMMKEPIKNSVEKFWHIFHGRSRVFGAKMALTYRYQNSRCCEWDNSGFFHLTYFFFNSLFIFLSRDNTFFFGKHRRNLPIVFTDTRTLSAIIGFHCAPPGIIPGGRLSLGQPRLGYHGLARGSSSPGSLEMIIIVPSFSIINLSSAIRARPLRYLYKVPRQDT